MGEVDYDAVEKSNKGLTICFIIGILAVNALLIFKNSRKNRFIYHPKCLTLISLAIGDIFLALFSLVVAARLLFEREFRMDISCSTNVSATTYYTSLLPFVYGVGLVVLAVEIVIRQSTQPSNNTGRGNIGMAIACSAIPWLLGLVIVLPLTMAGIECRYDDDFTIGRARAVYWVSMCLPAAGAVVVSIIVMFIRPAPAQTSGMALTSAPSQGAPQLPVTNDAAEAIHQPPTAPMTEHHQYQYPQQTPNHYPQYAPNQYYPSPQYPAQPYAPQPVVYMPAYIPQPSAFSASGPSDLAKEKNVLLWVSILHFFCVIPFAAFVLGYTLNDDTDHDLSTLALTVFDRTFYWLLIFRSVITPLIWVGCSRD